MSMGNNRFDVATLDWISYQDKVFKGNSSETWTCSVAPWEYLTAWTNFLRKFWFSVCCDVLWHDFRDQQILQYFKSYLAMVYSMWMVMNGSNSGVSPVLSLHHQYCVNSALMCFKSVPWNSSSMWPTMLNPQALLIYRWWCSFSYLIQQIFPLTFLYYSTSSFLQQIMCASSTWFCKVGGWPVSVCLLQTVL